MIQRSSHPRLIPCTVFVGFKLLQESNAVLDLPEGGAHAVVIERGAAVRGDEAPLTFPRLTCCFVAF